MRYAILSDIHGNHEALKAVLRDIERFEREQRAPIEAIWCLGDIVGYGPEPKECIRDVQAACQLTVAGNHDWAAIGKLDLDEFTAPAAESAEWTSKQLAPLDRVWLRNLPTTSAVGQFTLSHGSPTNPIWEYLTSSLAATPNFGAFDTPFCVVGHTHVPTIFLLSDDITVAPPDVPSTDTAILPSISIDSDMMPTPDLGPFPDDSEMMGTPEMEPFPDEPPPLCEHIMPSPGLWLMPEHKRAIINPGSVGQPRDGDPRAAYLIYDSDIGFEFRRVEYDIAATQRKMTEFGLSSYMAARLEKGV